MSAVVNYGPAGIIRIASPAGRRSLLRLASVLLLGVALASPAQAQFGDLSPEAQDNFGGALARGDFNNDGFQDLAIGVPYEGIRTGIPGPWPQIGSAGAVEVIYGSATGLQSSGRQIWRQGSNGIGDVPESGDNFGWSLTVAPERSRHAHGGQCRRWIRLRARGGRLQRGRLGVLGGRRARRGR